jgi:hypothetical protein
MHSGIAVNGKSRAVRSPLAAFLTTRSQQADLIGRGTWLNRSAICADSFLVLRR